MADVNLENKEYTAALREKFAKRGSDALNDTELLCLLLGFSGNKTDIQKLAVMLGERFGGVNNAYRAGYHELMGVDGMTRHSAVLIMLIGRLAALGNTNMRKSQSNPEYETQFLNLLRYTMREELWAAALDTEGAVCALERLACGSDVSVEVSAGALMRFAVRNGAKHVIIAHTHPDAVDPEESETDIYSKKYLREALNAAGVTLVGQIIIAGGRARMYQL